MTYFLNPDLVYQTHQESIEKFGGSSGVHEKGLLESAIEMPRQGFGDK